jgi:hypothetical protein
MSRQTMRRGILAILLLVLAVARPGAQAGEPTGGAPVPHPVTIEFFFETGCSECERVKREILPELEQRYAGYYHLDLFDVGDETNYLRLVTHQTRLGLRDNAPVYMLVDERALLPGVDRIRADLFAALDAAIVRRLDRPAAPPPDAEPGAAGLLQRHVQGFTLAGILSAAFVDSINPCAVATLVFFLSLLSVSHIGVRRMLLAGGAFVVASFVTYFLIGFGLLRVIHLLDGIPTARRVLDGVMVLVMLGFAAYSFRDAWRFHRTGRAADVSLKLPHGIQVRIHAVMKRGLRNRSLLLGGLGIGAAVTLLESVCTGQVYVPALVLMIKSGESVLRCALYLALYNTVFVLPLAVLLGLTCFGLGTPALVEWSRKNVVISKTLLGLFFLGMTLMMLALMR